MNLLKMAKVLYLYQQIASRLALTFADIANDICVAVPSVADVCALDKSTEMTFIYKVKKLPSVPPKSIADIRDLRNYLHRACGFGKDVSIRVIELKEIFVIEIRRRCKNG